MKLKSKNGSILDFNMRLLKLIIDPNTPLYEKYNFASIICSNLDEFIAVRLYRSDINERNKLLKLISFIYSVISKVINEMIEKFKSNKNYNDDLFLYQNYFESNLNIMNEIKVENNKVYYAFLDSDNNIGFIESKKRIISVNGNYTLEEIIIEKYLIAKYKIKEFGIFKLIRRQNYFLSSEVKDINTSLDNMNSMLIRKNNNKWEMIQTNISNKDFIEKIKKSISINYDIDIININSYIFNIDDYRDIIKQNMISNNFYKKIDSYYKRINFQSELKNGDLLFYTPFHSYDFITDFIDEMCESDNIEYIFQTIYRLSNKSKIVKSLCNAAKLGKKVIVSLELSARGNEKSNIEYANQLKKAGCKIIYGYYGFKIHMKTFCAVSKNGEIYSHLSTGNYNEDNSKFYTDYSLISLNKNIGSNLLIFFDIVINKKINYSSLIDDLFITNSNFDNKSIIIYNIEREKMKGIKGKIYIKCNNIYDEDIIERLHDAALYGVDIKIICRTICPLKQITKNFQVRCKLGQLLEHDRLYIFDDNVYLSSFDLLPRNLDRRLESLVPIYDSNIKNDLLSFFKINWNTSNFQVNKFGKWDIIK